MCRPKQGYKDSNLEMTESESGALPFGDTPMSFIMIFFVVSAALAVDSDNITHFQIICKHFFKLF